MASPKIFPFLCLVFGFVDLTKAADCTTCTAIAAGNCVTNQEFCGGNPYNYEDPQITYGASAGCLTVTLTCQGYDNLYIDGVTTTAPDGSDGGVLISQADSPDPSTLLVTSGTLTCDATGTWNLGGQPIGNIFDCQVWTPVSTTTTTTTPTTTPTPPTCTTCTALPAGACVTNQNGCNGNPFYYKDPLISYSTNSAGCRVATLTCLGYDAVFIDGVNPTVPDGSDGGVMLGQEDNVDPTSAIVVTSQVTCDSNGVWNIGGQPVGNNFDCQASITEAAVGVGIFTTTIVKEEKVQHTDNEKNESKMNNAVNGTETFISDSVSFVYSFVLIAQLKYEQHLKNRIEDALENQNKELGINFAYENENENENDYKIKSKFTDVLKILRMKK